MRIGQRLINGKLISNFVLCGALIATFVFFYALFSAVVLQYYVTFPLVGVLSPVKLAGLGVFLAVLSPMVMVIIKAGNNF